MKQHGVLHDEADVLPQRSLLQVPEVHAVDSHHAAGGVIEARQQAGDGRLARARGADQRGHLAWVDFEADVAQHDGLGVVAEADAVELDLAAQERHGLRVRQVFHGAIGVEHFADALIRDRGFRVGIGELGKLLHGLVHFAQVEDEHDQRARRKAPVEHHVRAEPQDGGGAGGDDHLHKRREARLEAARLQRQIDALHALHFHAPLLVILAGEDADDAHGRESLADDRDHLAFFLAHRARGLLDLPRIGVDDNEKRGRYRERNQRELPVDIEHHADHSEQREHADQRAQQSGHNEALHRLDIAGDAADQVARVFLVVIRQREALDVVVHGAPQLVQHLLADRHGERFFRERA